ncbi:hypothetical protein AB1N83_007116 [Pleurotus pulmonarius]
MTPPNQFPWTQHQSDAHPSRQALYEYEPLGWTASQQRELALEEPDPPSVFSARGNARCSQKFGGGIVSQHAGSTPDMPFNSTRPNNEYNVSQGGCHPWPVGPVRIATEATQVTTNDSMARDGGCTTLWRGNMSPVNFEAPSREIYPMPTYPAGIAAELSAVIPQGFGSGNSTLWNEVSVAHSLPPHYFMDPWMQLATTTFRFLHPVIQARSPGLRTVSTSTLKSFAPGLVRPRPRWKQSGAVSIQAGFSVITAPTNSRPRPIAIDTILRISVSSRTAAIVESRSLQRQISAVIARAGGAHFDVTSHHLVWINFWAIAFLIAL